MTRFAKFLTYFFTISLGILINGAYDIIFYPGQINIGKTRISEENSLYVPQEIKDPKKIVNPKNLIVINKIGVSAPLEEVGFDEKGNMASPSNGTNVAYYNQGAKIGSVGNAVVSGHRDTAAGKAVFYRLAELEVGDVILVSDSSGKAFKYIVSSTRDYATENFPTMEVFSNANEARLQLITCVGNYDKAKKSYNKRLVVSAKLDS